MKNENFHDVIYVKRTEENGIIFEITSPSISFTLLTLIFFPRDNNDSRQNCRGISYLYIYFLFLNF